MDTVLILRKGGLPFPFVAAVDESISVSSFSRIFYSSSMFLAPSLHSSKLPRYTCRVSHLTTDGYLLWLINGRPSGNYFTFSSSQPPPRTILTMCEFYRNYYVYSSCADPGVHYFRTSTDGVGNVKCGRAPHERYIVVAGKCTQCP